MDDKGAEALEIKRFDLCPYAICTDYFTDERIRFDKLLDSEKIRAVRPLPCFSSVVCAKEVDATFCRMSVHRDANVKASAPERRRWRTQWLVTTAAGSSR